MHKLDSRGAILPRSWWNSSTILQVFLPEPKIIFRVKKYKNFFVRDWPLEGTYVCACDYSGSVLLIFVLLVFVSEVAVAAILDVIGFFTFVVLKSMQSLGLT